MPAARLREPLALRGPALPGTVLFFDNCPPDVWKLEGKDIWGGANNIMLGDVEIAEREGYTKIRFVVDSISAVLDKAPAPEEPPDQPD
jgi:hypothetical protein